VTVGVVTAPAEPAAPSAPVRVLGGRGFAVAALVAGGLGVAAPVAPAGPVRLALVLAFLLVGPGSAVMSYVRVDQRSVAWALALTASLTVACAVAVTTLWTHVWQPRVALLGMTGAVGLAVLVRLALDRPVPVPVRAVRTAVGYDSAALAPVVLLGAGIVLWWDSLRRLDPSTVDGYGLTRALGVPFVAGVVLIGVGFATELFGRSRTAVVTLGLLAVAAVLHATVPLIYGTLEYAWTYKHLGVVDLIRDNGHLLDNVDIYQQWPGFFAAMALLSGVAGVEAVHFATWSSLAFDLLNMLLLAALLRQFTGNRRVIALAVLLFESCMWVDIGYFSPQAFVYALMIGFWLIVSRWLMVTPPEPPAGAGRIARLRGWLLRGLPERPAHSRRTRLVAGTAATAVFAAIVVSHQLTPFLMMLPAAILAVLGVLRPRSTVVVWGLVLAVFLAPRLLSVARQYGLFNFDVATNAAGNADTWRTPEQEFSALVARTLALGVWALAGLVVLRAIRRPGAVLVPAVIGFAPFVTLGGQNYGGEAIYRVFAFSLPFAALLIAGVWAGRRRGEVAATVSGVVLAAMTLAALQGLQGQLALHRVPAADIRAARYFYAHAAPRSSLVLVAPTFPTRLTGNYGSFNVGRTIDVSLTDDPAWTGRLDGARLPEVEQWIRQLGTRENYLVVNDQMSAYTDYFGRLPRGSVASLDSALRGSPRWQVFFAGTGVTIYRLVPAS
jgi:hypothetical protein